MTDQSQTTTRINLAERFPEAVSIDSRPGYEGYLIKADVLLPVAQAIRDEFGYDLLSSVTGVDYYPENSMEVVYHALQTTGGSMYVFKVQVPRDNPVLPSVVTIWPGAELQEREAWDLLGIKFEGHPDLRRILMWEGFEGHPLRKDWKEPYFEEDVKPYKSRWPDGHVKRMEAVVPLGDNVKFPAEFDPESWIPDGDEALYKGLKKLLEDSGSELKTDRLIVNLGPQHPSTHGVFRMVVVLDGETIVGLKPVFGYLHRNHEKIGERCTWIQNMPFTDRLDYISSMSNNFGYALAVEKLMGVKPPERGDYLRVIMAELTRIISHLISIGFLLNDLGAFFTPVLYCFEERELILDVFEAVSGSRMMCNYFRFGGVARDIPEDALRKLRELVNERLSRKIDELDKYLTRNEIIRSRTEGIGVITAEQAIERSATGPILRASGVPYDIRRADPYSIYDRFEFDVAVRYHGDVYDRYLVRLDEIRQSIRILKQALRDLPEGPVLAGKPQWQVRVPAGEAYGLLRGIERESKSLALPCTGSILR
jgi:NADH-quinone oxidoreductase subunit C/D